MVAKGANKLLAFCEDELELVLDAVELVDNDELSEHDEMSEQAWLMLEASASGFWYCLGLVIG